jgi:hypothetical protein
MYIIGRILKLLISRGGIHRMKDISANPRSTERCDIYGSLNEGDGKHLPGNYYN